ncbi:MAG: hypothetical protein ACEQSA_01430 [Weeksellaceae bacterium]
MAEQFRYTDIRSTCTRDDVGFMRHFYGAKGAHHVMESRGLPVSPLRGPHLSLEEKLSLIDEHFFTIVEDEYGVATSETANFYFRQLQHANNAIAEFTQTVFPEDMNNILGLRNEVAFPTHRPSERLTKLARPRSKVEEFEIRRQLILANIAAQLEANEQHAGVSDAISMLQHVLNVRVFDPSAHTEFLTVDSYHDNITNKCVNPHQYGTSYHKKTHPIQARYVDDIGYVLTQPRIKNMSTSVLKAVSKSQRTENGLIDPFSVQDLGGIMFVALGGSQYRDALMDKIYEAVSSFQHIGKPQDDQVTSNGRSNGTALDWRRIQLPIGQQGGTIELQFYDLEGYLDNVYNLSDQGNRAHRLYQVKRSRSLLPILFPSDVYQDVYSKIDLEEAIAYKEDSIRAELLAKRRV